MGEILPNSFGDYENGTLSLIGDEEVTQICCDAGNSRGARSKCINLNVLGTYHIAIAAAIRLKNLRFEYVT